MDRHFKALSIFLILSLIVIFSSCTDDTGITIYSGETTTEAESIQISTEEITTAAPETETDTKEETTKSIENHYQTEYLLNTNTKKFHYPSCKSGQRTKDANRANYNGSRDEIIAKGYSPCKVCNP